jgi:chromate transport protein ChrA
MAPVAIGLMLAGTFAIARLSIFNVTSMLIAVSTFALLLRRHINPALLVLSGGVTYMLLPHVVRHLFPH